MLDEQQLRCVECYGQLNPDLSCRQCGTKYERAPSGAFPGLAGGGRSRLIQGRVPAFATSGGNTHERR